jgi:hypothetical protein
MTVNNICGNGLCVVVKKKKLWIKYKEFNLMVVGIVSDIINLLGHKFMQMSMTP